MVSDLPNQCVQYSGLIDTSHTFRERRIGMNSLMEDGGDQVPLLSKLTINILPLAVISVSRNILKNSNKNGELVPLLLKISAKCL